MFKFLQKYSLVLVISITAGLLIGFKTFHSTHQGEVMSETLYSNGERIEDSEPSRTSRTIPSIQPTPTISNTPKPTKVVTPTLSEEQMMELLEEFGIDPDNPEESVMKILNDLDIDPENPKEEDLQKILDFLDNAN